MRYFARFGTIFVQIKKRLKHPWRSVTYSKVAGLSLRSNTHPWVFFMLFLQVVPNRAKHHILTIY